MGKLSRLKELYLFQGLSEGDLVLLAHHANMRDCAQGDMIFRQGEPADSFFVLAHGAVKLFRSTTEGREQTLYLVEKGEPFCLCTLFYQDAIPVSAQAVMPSQLFVFPGSVIERFARSEPQVLFNVLRVLNDRLMRAIQMIEDLALRDIQQRTASFLLHSLRNRTGESDRVTLTVPRREVAKILGTTPETLSRVLARFVQEGVIEADKRRIDILSTIALEELAG